MVEEDLKLRLGRGAFEQKSKLNESIEDLVGEVTSAVEESIRDEVGDSRVTTSKLSKQSNSEKKSFERPESARTTAVLLEIEKAIDSERSEREEQLARDLKRRKISPRAYDRAIREIERWVIKEKKELWQRRRRATENHKDLLKYAEKFRKDRLSVPLLTGLASPRPDSGLQ